MVIFHDYVSHNQMVNKKLAQQICGCFSDDLATILYQKEFPLLIMLVILAKTYRCLPSGNLT